VANAQDKDIIIGTLIIDDGLFTTLAAAPDAPNLIRQLFSLEVE
jgi:hypothetical protein